MASGHPALTPEIGPDGLARDSPVIAYTEKVESSLQSRQFSLQSSQFSHNYSFKRIFQVIEAEQLQLKKYALLTPSLLSDLLIFLFNLCNVA
jgi:hypothetical protein